MKEPKIINPRADDKKEKPRKKRVRTSKKDDSIVLETKETKNTTTKKSKSTAMSNMVLSDISSDTLSKLGSAGNQKITNLSTEMMSRYTIESVNNLIDDEAFRNVINITKDFDVNSLVKLENQKSKGFLAKLFSFGGTTVEKVKDKYQTVEGQMVQFQEKLESALEDIEEDYIWLESAKEINFDRLEELGELKIVIDNTLEEQRTILQEMVTNPDDYSLREIDEKQQSVRLLELKQVEIATQYSLCQNFVPQLQAQAGVNRTIKAQFVEISTNMLSNWRLTISSYLQSLSQAKYLNASRDAKEANEEMMKKNSTLIRNNVKLAISESEKSTVSFDTVKFVTDNTIGMMEDCIGIRLKAIEERNKTLQSLENYQATTKIKLLQIEQAQNESNKVLLENQLNKQNSTFVSSSTEPKLENIIKKRS